MSQFNKPLVTAIVSTYNSEKYIKGCLDSLVAQTMFERLEIIIVISGSKQNEETIAQQYQDKYGHIIILKTFEREGLYKAWNRAIELSRGKYLTNANTDDRLAPRAYEMISSVLEMHEDIALVYPDCWMTSVENEQFSTTQSSTKLPNQDYCLYDLLRNCFVGPMPMWRRSIHQEIGYYDESFVSAADYDFYIRAACKYDFLHLRETLGLFLDSPGSISHQKIGTDEALRILSRHRREIPLEIIFPSLHETSDSSSKSMAYAAMAEVSTTGIWHPDLDLAFEYLQKARVYDPSNMLIDNNLAVLFGLRQQFDDAAILLQKHISNPICTENLGWIFSLKNGGCHQSGIMMPVSHDIVSNARKLKGIDADELKPLYPKIAE